MGRNREPVSLILAKGNKPGLTREEIEERRAQEVKVDLKNVTAPDYLPAALKGKFDRIATKLLQVGIMTELDEDLLARYVLSERNYLQYVQLNMEAIKAGDMENISRTERLKKSAFEQSHACASALGLTITSRCKLVVPQVEVQQPKNKFDRFRSSS